MDRWARQVYESRTVNGLDLAEVQMWQLHLESEGGSCYYRHSLLLTSEFWRLWIGLGWVELCIDKEG